jgi:hypothetical protein
VCGVELVGTAALAPVSVLAPPLDHLLMHAPVVMSGGTQVGVAGPSGAGKSVFCQKIQAFIPGCATISMDNYNDGSKVIDGNFDGEVAPGDWEGVEWGLYKGHGLSAAKTC